MKAPTPSSIQVEPYVAAQWGRNRAVRAAQGHTGLIWRRGSMMTAKADGHEAVGFGLDHLTFEAPTFVV